MWEKEVMADQPEEDLFSESPLCGICKIPMVTRTNRMNKKGFWGCVRFPLCRETLPMTYGGQPTKVVQQALADEAKKHAWMGTKGTGRGYPKVKAEKMERRRPSTLSNELRGVSSDGSWVRAEAIPIEESSEDEEEEATINTNLTAEETQMIKEMRLAKADEKK